jgi:hypothetical protein
MTYIEKASDFQSAVRTLITQELRDNPGYVAGTATDIVVRCHRDGSVSVSCKISLTVPNYND